MTTGMICAMCLLPVISRNQALVSLLIVTDMMVFIAVWKRNIRVVRYVYDCAGHLIFSQDGVQRGKSVPEWTFYLYDKFDRQVAQGICTNPDTASVGNKVVEAVFDASSTGSYRDMIVTSNFRVLLCFGRIIMITTAFCNFRDFRERNTCCTKASMCGDR